MPTAIWLCLLIATFANHACCYTTTNSQVNDAVILRVGISLGLEAPANESTALLQRHAFEGLSVWVNAFNNYPVANRTSKDGRHVSFELVVFENHAYFHNETAMREHIIGISVDPTLDFVLPPVGSQWGTNLRIASLATGHVPFTIGIVDSKEIWYQLDGSYGAPTSTLSVMYSTIPYLRINGAKTAFVISMQDTFQLEMCQGFSDQAPFQDIKVVHTETMPFDYTDFGAPTTDAIKARWDAITDDLIAKNADVMVMCDYGIASEYVISLLRTKKYTPKAIVLSYKYAEFEDQSLLEFVNVPRSYHTDARFPKQALFVDSKGYDQLISATYGHAASFYNAQATLAGFLLSNAILLAADNSSLAIENALKTAQFSSFMGIARFDPQRRQLMDHLIIQRVGLQDIVVGPAIAAKSSMIYPMPTWDERTFSRQWGKHWSEMVGAVLMAIGMAVSLFWIGFIIVHWNKRTIFAASPIFCILILVGSIVIYGSNITWMPSLASDSVCAMRTWLLPIGFMIVFGSLIGKTWRIHRLYFAKGLVVTSGISNTHVLLVVFSMISIQVLLSILMMTVGKVKSRIHIVDEWRVSLNYHECYSSPALKYIYGVNLVYAVFILALDMYLAYRVRKVPFNLYNESHVILAATTFMVASAIVAAVIQLAMGKSQRFIAYFIVTLCMFIGLMATIAFLFVTKLISIYWHGDANSIKRSSLNSSGSTHSSSNNHKSHGSSSSSPVAARDGKKTGSSKTHRKSASVGASTTSSASQPEAKRHNYSLGTSVQKSSSKLEMSVIASPSSIESAPLSYKAHSMGDSDGIGSNSIKHAHRALTMKNERYLLSLEVERLKVELAAAKQANADAQNVV
jgi:hypothetical protein